MANKADLQVETPPDLEESALQAYSEKKGFLAFFKTSAKQGQGIDEAVKALIAEVMRNDIAFQRQAHRAKTQSTAKLRPHPDDRDNCAC